MRQPPTRLPPDTAAENADASGRACDLHYQSDDARWLAVQTRDPQAVGHFVYGVRTTGVYCPPDSASRRPARDNVVFFDTPAHAEQAGYRPSRRAGADKARLAAEHARAVANACRIIEEASQAPDLTTLAAQVGISPHHFHRLFKATTGVTPKAYATAARARRLRQELQEGDTSVTDAIYEAGFNSNSRFYEASHQLLGMRAKDFRAGAPGMRILFAVGQSFLGAILVAISVRGVCAILLGEDPETLVHDLQDQFPRAELIGGDEGFEQVMAQVVGFVENPASGLELPLDMQGTAFQQRVWQALRTIPYGETVSYTDIAKRIGSPRSVRAVANACGANHLAVAIPCHRVVRQNGDIAGYRWGVERKTRLLAREAQGSQSQ